MAQAYSSVIGVLCTVLHGRRKKRKMEHLEPATSRKQGEQLEGR